MMNKMYYTIYCVALTAVAALAAAAGYAAGKARAEADWEERAEALKRECRAQFRADLLDYAGHIVPGEAEAAPEADEADPVSPWEEAEEETL